MKPKTIILLSLQLSIYTLFGQNITGKWYEIQNPNAILEITIDKNNDTYSGTYNWEWKNRTNTINAPLDKVLIKNDSLLIKQKLTKVFFISMLVN